MLALWNMKIRDNSSATSHSDVQYRKSMDYMSLCDEAGELKCIVTSRIHNFNSHYND